MGAGGYAGEHGGGGNGSWAQIWPVPQGPSRRPPVPGRVEIPQDRIRGGAWGRGEGEDRAFSLFYFFPLN